MVFFSYNLSEIECKIYWIFLLRIYNNFNLNMILYYLFCAIVPSFAKNIKIFKIYGGTCRSTVYLCIIRYDVSRFYA